MNKIVLFIMVFTIVCSAQNALFVEFNEAMDTIGIRDKGNYELSFIPTPETVALSIYHYPVRIDSIGFTQWSNVVILFTSEHPDTTGIFQVKVFNVFDLAGNEINLEKNIAHY